MAVNVVLKSVFDDKGIKKALGEFQDFGAGIGKAFAAVGAVTAVAAAALVKFGADSIAAAENVAQANNRLGQVAKSMDLFGSQTQAVTDRLIKFAEANELLVAVDAEVIKATQAKLLTFKNLAQTANVMGGEFDRATMAALDLAAAGFGSAETNATQLGKALQDPIKGITALTRSGVTFTQEERNKIKVMVESGQVLEAQNMILSAIEKQVGGTAEATAKASDKMKLAFDNISESVGAALLPVFNEFVDEVVKITPELEDALAPAAAEIATIFRERVLPAIQNFTKWLASPEGTKTLKDLTNAVIDAITGFLDFTRFLIDNYKTIGTLTIGLGALYAAIRLTITGVQLWTAAQVILNSALGPLYLLATVLAGIAAGLILISANAKKASNPLEAAEMRVAGLESELKNLEDAYNSGTIEQAAYKRQTDAIKKALDEARNAVARLNNSDLSQFRTQLGDTRINGQRLANNMRELYFAMRGIKPPKMGHAFTGGDELGGTVESAFSKVQKFIKDAQKDLLDAQADFNKAVSNAQKKYAADVIKTEKEFAQRLANIVIESQNRLRTAYAQATATNVTDLFNTFKTDQQRRKEEFEKAQEDLVKAQEKLTEANRELQETLADPKRTEDRLRTATQRFEEAKREFNKVVLVVNKGFTEEDPVQALVNSLRDRLKDSVRLLSNSAALAAGGFSQTFIEQIVVAGTNTGNELAEAILNSTPEIQRELQDLFITIERQSNSGMDALSKSIYEKQGLATAALKDLYAQTQDDLQVALYELRVAFDQEIIDANNALIAAIGAVRTAFQENINSMKGDLGGLESTVNAFLARLGAAQTQAKARVDEIVKTPPTAPTLTPRPNEPSAIMAIAAADLGEAAGIFIDSAKDLVPVMSFLAGLANDFNRQASLLGTGSEANRLRGLAADLGLEIQKVNLLSGKPITGQTIINVNVKADSTQSLAMVGKTLGNTINKYVTTGGQVLVSPVG